MNQATQSAWGDFARAVRTGVRFAGAPTVGVACAVAAMVAYGATWLSDDDVGRDTPVRSLNAKSGVHSPSVDGTSGRNLWAAVAIDFSASRGMEPRTPASASSPSAPSPHVKPHFEWQIGVDQHDGRALYTAWAAWLRTQNRSDLNVGTLGIALEGIDGNVRTEVAAAAIGAGDSVAVVQSLTGAHFSNQEISDLGRAVSTGDVERRTAMLRSAADANSSVLIQALIDLKQIDPAGYGDALAVAMGPCPASTAARECFFLSSVFAIAPSFVDELVSVSAADAVVCGMPNSVGDFRSILTSDKSARWCVSRPDDALNGGLL